jgi:hypothetical protein
MPAKNKGGRKDRLAAALKENLRRRKAQAKKKAEGKDGAPPARTLGTAPQAGLENKPQAQQKSAPKAR